MTFEKELEIIKIAAFNDELIKLGISPVFIKNFSRLGGKALKVLNKNLSSNNILRRSSNFIAREASKGTNAKEVFRRGVERAAKIYGPNKSGLAERIVVDKKTGKAQMMFKATNTGPRLSKNPIQWSKTRANVWGGELATNLNTMMQQGQGEGVRSFFKNEVVKGGWKLDKATGNYKRKGPLGRLGGYAMTGPGFGVLDFALGGKDEKGNKVELGKRTLRAAGTGIGFTVAPKLFIASSFARAGVGAARGSKNKEKTINANNNYNY
jgi:hypothetical protein